MGSSFCWPDNAAFAVSLTYDDGHPSNLQHAVPQLEAAGWRGTFYLDTARKVVRQHIREWREVFERGHEIGNHSVNHPCRIDSFPARPDWLTHPLEQYTPQQIRGEVAEAAAWLNEHIGQDIDRTYAYPCCDSALGIPADEASYVRAVREHHFAARAGGDRINLPSETDLMRLAGYMVDEPTLEDLLAPCRKADMAGGWAVMIFHATGEDGYLRTSPNVHASFLQQLASMPCWVAPLKAVARHVQQSRSQAVSA
jgi:peptidoglycan/xylan/chitin deacetylase (PgdA/CDA1 family)